MSFYSRKPVVVLPRLRKKKRSKQSDPEKGAAQEDNQEYEDALDQHVEDVLRKRDKFRRIMQGVWAFTKTREYYHQTLQKLDSPSSDTALGVSLFILRSTNVL